MTNYSAKSIDEYIQSAPLDAQPHLEEIRATIRAVVPDAVETISYGKPYYKYDGYLAGFDTYKNHIGFELWVDQLDDDDRSDLEKMGYKTGSRTFQIRYDQNVPIEMIEKLVKAKVERIKLSKS